MAENDAAVVSVFVNPTQFNDQNDLIKYPRTPEADCRLLEECGGCVCFCSGSGGDVSGTGYAPIQLRTFGYGNGRSLSSGTLNGVCQIVSKLFDAVQPDRAYSEKRTFSNWPLSVKWCVR